MDFKWLRAGIQLIADGGASVARCNKESAQVVSLGDPAMTEAASRGQVFTASNAVAGVALGTAFSTTPPLFIWNPPNSGKALSIYRVNMGYVSGTLGAGCVAIGKTAQVTVPTTGAELVPVNNAIGAAVGVGRAFTGSTITAASTIIRSLFNVGPMLATSVFAPNACEEKLDGEIVVMPGFGVSISGIATAGTTDKVILSAVWKEIPV